MKKFEVYGEVTLNVTMTVEAETAEEAREKAERAWPGLTRYDRDRGSGDFIGTTARCVSLSVQDGGPGFSQVVEV
jgi:hypothetical protein